MARGAVPDWSTLAHDQPHATPVPVGQVRLRVRLQRRLHPAAGRIRARQAMPTLRPNKVHRMTVAVVTEASDHGIRVLSCPAAELVGGQGALVLWPSSRTPIVVPYAWVFSLRFTEVAT